MSQLESMLALLNQTLAAKGGGGAVATLERDSDAEEVQKRQAATAALQRWINECKPLEKTAPVGGTGSHDPALNQALAQFVGFEVQAKPGQPYPLPIVPTRRAHGHGGAAVDMAAVDMAAVDMAAADMAADMAVMVETAGVHRQRQRRLEHQPPETDQQPQFRKMLFAKNAQPL